jgi:hypothetical protein
VVDVVASSQFCACLKLKTFMFMPSTRRKSNETIFDIYFWVVLDCVREYGPKPSQSKFAATARWSQAHLVGGLDNTLAPWFNLVSSKI